MLGKKEAKGPPETLSIEVPSELVQRFRDIAHWHDLDYAEAGEAALLLYVLRVPTVLGGAESNQRSQFNLDII